MIAGIFAFVFVALCLYAAMRDVETLTITNGLNATIAFLFIPAAIVVAPGWDVTGGHLLAGAIAFAISVLLFVFGVFGGGDAKMIPAVMLWLGPGATMPFLTAMAVIGGGLAITVILARRLVPAGAAPGFARETMSAGNGVPYGVAIAGGVIYAAPYSPLLASLNF
ncbi:A24 family peptidase [Henriciella litoralis]|uniref:A24 family peptidase n=1 Tax=Henriciella litoralis TaxID=568102 RepID=UPI000A00B2F4|nr:prepilin peptidase [Henriciella litoralis]